MKAGDIIDLPAEGEWFRIQRSAHHDGGPLQFEWRLQPGHGGPPTHVHPHDHEIFRVLSGRARVELGGQVQIVEAGETVRMPAGVPHQVRGEGKEPLCAVVTYDDGYRFEFILDILTEPGFPGFSKMSQAVLAHPDVLYQTSWFIRSALRVAAFVGRLLGHRYAGPVPTGRPLATT